MSNDPNPDDSWTAERWQKDGTNYPWEPMTAAELLDTLTTALQDPETGSVVVYRTPRNKS